MPILKNREHIVRRWCGRDMVQCSECPINVNHYDCQSTIRDGFPYGNFIALISKAKPEFIMKLSASVFDSTLSLFPKTKLL